MSNPTKLLESMMAGPSTSRSLDTPSKSVDDMDDVVIDADDLIEAEDAALTVTSRSSPVKTAKDLRKFIAGEISFDELASVMGSDEDDDGDDDEWVEEGEPEEDEDGLLNTSKRKKRKIATTKAGRKRHKGRGRSKRSTLDQTEECLLGEANCRFVAGRHQEAIDMMYELIKQKPMAHEPYNDLGEMFEQMNQFDKALQYFYLAAHLCPNDGDYWQTTAEKHLEHQQLETAIKCFTKAIKSLADDDKKIQCKFIRSTIHEMLYYSCDPETDPRIRASHLKEAISGYHDVVSILDAQREDHSDYIEQIPKVAKLHYENGDLNSAIKLMDESFEKFDVLVEINNVNMYLELLICQKAFTKALFMFHKYCGINFKLLNEEQPFHIENILNHDFIYRNHLQLEVQLTCELQIDLRAKLVVCLIDLNCLYSVSEIQSVLLERCSAEEAGDLFFAIAKSYLDRSMFLEAEPFLKRAVEAEETFGSDPEYWLRLARCLKELSKDEESIKAYKKVILLSPYEIDARLELSQLLLAHDRSDEAVEVATQPLEKNQDEASHPSSSLLSSHTFSFLDSGGGDSSGEKINLDLLLVRAQLLYRQKNYIEFVRVARILLLSDMVYLNDVKEMDCMISSSCVRTRIDSLKGVRKDLTKEIAIQKDRYSGRLPSSDALFDIWIKLCQVLSFELPNAQELERIVFSAFTCQSFSDRERQLEYVSLMSLFKTRRCDNNILYSLVRAVILRNTQNNQLWNLFSAIMARMYQDLRHNRFCLRLFPKHPDLLPLSYFNGHNALMSGSYKYAVADYLTIVKQRPNDPFPAFLSALAFVHIACQKYITNKNSVVIQMVALMDKYVELRGECQESFYNFGRAFHTIGLMHSAAHMYKKALECPVPVQGKDSDRFDLRPEIAYNLSQIYRSSGSTHLSLYYLHRYCTV